MNIWELDTAKVGAILGEEIPSVFVVIAKHQVLGLNESQIAEILSADLTEVQAALQDELYKRVKECVAEAHAESTVEQTTGWDAVENMALKSLIKRLPLMERDPEFLLRAATLANRATRKHAQASNVLDPGLRVGTRTITLTQRLVRQINGRGEQAETETREVSIKDGSMSNPTFGEVDSLLSVRNVPVLSKALEIKTHPPDDPTDEELFQDFLRR